MNKLAPKDDIDMFNEWAEKVESLLKKNDEHSLAYLPTASQWLRYRAKKIQVKNPEKYNVIMDRFVSLAKESALKQSANLFRDLDRAKKHKLGTHIRVKIIVPFAYHFAHYAYPNFIEGNAKDELRKCLSFFWSEYLHEIVEHRNFLNDEKILWIIQLAELSKEAGYNPNPIEISVLKAQIATRHPRRNRTFANSALIEQLTKDIQEWETHTIEFKRRATSDSELAETIAGFATANAGKIYIGINPDKTTEGVEIDEHLGKDNFQRRIARITNDVIRPKIRVRLHFIITNTHKTVVRIDVPKGTEPVYYVDYRPFIRYLSQTKKMEPFEVKETYEKNFRSKNL